MIKKAIILAAGKGTRMHVVTKGASKEMLTLKDKPIIFYSIREALDAGCSEICIVLNHEKKDLIAYITEQQEGGAPLTMLFREPKGIMDAIAATKDFVMNEHFALILPDMLHIGAQNATRTVCEVCEYYQNHVIALIPEPRGFGNGAYAHVQKVGGNIFSIKKLIHESGEGIRLFGRYAFLNSIFSYLSRLPHAESEAVLLTALIDEGALYGTLLTGDTFDTGIPEGYTMARQSHLGEITYDSQ